jgi:hypothetical protein
MVGLPYDGDVYALSLDFNERHLEQIISKTTPQLAAALRRELTCDPSSARTRDLDGEVRFAVRARLGQPQKTNKESFVPLVCQDIM